MTVSSSLQYNQLQSLEKYVLSGHHQVRGWLWHSAAYITSLMGLEQVRQGMVGNVGEIGVWQGRYLQLLGLLGRPEETILGIDSFVHAPDGDAFEHQLRERFEVEPALEGRLRILRRDSTTLTPDEIRQVVDGPFRLFSVDGGHLAHEAFHDLKLCAPLMSEDGIIIVDDIFNVTCPGVVEGTLRFLMSNEGADFEAFCISGNKMFLGRRSATPAWRKFLMKVTRQCTDVSLFRDTAKTIDDMPPGVFPQFCGGDVVVITWSGDYLISDNGEPVVIRLKVCDPAELNDQQCILPSPLEIMSRL
ncbi:hypothetical protein CA13_41670 [Planctomycetes bacterium CA13]|uniref:Class I SAM-dependent methyltransferase n=1 Tax=Novipirellula herctigrandis TaxID=2527986 RepID=A0A5C5Z625_9BACT|nr:hypothetical protein CA13_41670 [Planctomycetes bacterium CA13]